MRQVFQNIISNALKFSKQDEQPQIEIWSEPATPESDDGLVAEDNHYCRIFISDNGIGFNEQYLDKIFTMFQRLHGKAEYEGTGIGLSIVKKIVEKHQGSVTAKSIEGEGATFVITLPVKQVAKNVSV